MDADSKSGSAGLWSLADQGAVSLGNCLTNIFLARALVPADYGVFALVYGMLVLMNTYHSCVVVYPLSLSGAAGTIEELRRHVRRSICLTLLLAFPLGLVVLGAALFLGKPEITLWVIVAVFCWQVQETLRRGLMAHLRHRDAIWGDAISYLGQAAVIWLYLGGGHRSLGGIFSVLSVTSLLGAAVQSKQIGLRMTWEADLFRQLKESWRVSRWAVLANTAAVVPGVAYPWFLALRGTYLAASYQALLNIIGVSNPVMMSVGNVVLPATVRANAEDGLRSGSRAVFRCGLLGAAVLFPCFTLIFFWPDFFLKIFYGSASAYLIEVKALQFLVGAYSFGYVEYLLGALFYGLGFSKKVLQGQAAGAVAAVVVGIPLIRMYGVCGASAGICSVYAVQVLVFSFILRGLKSGRTLPVDSCEEQRLGGCLVPGDAHEMRTAPGR